MKVHKGEYRYSSSPLGKRFDIYETSEAEDQEDTVISSNLSTGLKNDKLTNYDGLKGCLDDVEADD